MFGLSIFRKSWRTDQQIREAAESMTDDQIAEIDPEIARLAKRAREQLVEYLTNYTPLGSAPMNRDEALAWIEEQDRLEKIRKI